MVWALLGNVAAYFPHRDFRLQLLREVTATVHAAAAYARLPWVDQGAVPEPKYSPDITMGSLRSLLDSGDLDLDTPVPPAAALQAAVQYGISAEANPVRLAHNDPVRITTVFDLRLTPAGPGCKAAEPAGPQPMVVFEQGDHGSVSLRPPPGELKLRVVNGQGSSAVRPVPPTTSASEVVLRLAVDTGQPVVELPAGGPTLICGAG